MRRFYDAYLSYQAESLCFFIDLVGADRTVVGPDNFNAKDNQYPSTVIAPFNLPA